MVQEEVAGQKVSGLMIPPVGPIETLKILDFWWSRRRWLARSLVASPVGLIGTLEILDA